MNTSKLADISEIISSIAIVVTLVFLTIQVNQNTQSTHASTRQSIFETDTQIVLQNLNNPEVWTYLTKPQLSAEETNKLFWQMLVFFKARENLWAQYDQSVLDEGSWERYYNASKIVLAYPRARHWWINYGAKYLDPGFVNIVLRDFDKIPIFDSTVDERMSSYFEMSESPDMETN